MMLMMMMGTLCKQECSFLQSQYCRPPQSLVWSPFQDNVNNDADNVDDFIDAGYGDDFVDRYDNKHS